VNLLHPEFVMSVGDLIEGYPIADRRAQQIELTNMTSKVEAPFFYVVGNHDIGRSRAHPPGFERANEETTALWKEFYGENTYYSFVYKNVLFVCLNTVEGRDTRKKPVGITDTQYAWFKKTLDSHPDVRWTMIFMHQPAEWLTDAWLKFELSELVKRKYTVFAGDWHTYLHARRHGRDYYVLSVAGGCSASNHKNRTKLLGEEYGEFDHITWVTMQKGGPTVVNLKLEGIIPGEYLTQATTKSQIYHPVIDIPPDPKVCEKMMKLKAEKVSRKKGER
jgi:hypothetical protein